jgi:hypothetical protein
LKLVSFCPVKKNILLIWFCYNIKCVIWGDRESASHSS